MILVPPVDRSGMAVLHRQSWLTWNRCSRALLPPSVDAEDAVEEYENDQRGLADYALCDGGRIRRVEQVTAEATLGPWVARSIAVKRYQGMA